MKGRDSHLAVRVVVIGDFQIGKSSFVNCLLAETRAEMGEGFFPTTEASAEYMLVPGVILVDTPGFNDSRRELEDRTNEEIAKSDIILFIKTEKILGERDRVILRKSGGKKTIVLFNCTNKTIGRRGWIPDAKANADTCDKIRSQLVKEGMDAFLLRIDGKSVFPVNILWAHFGLGLPITESQQNDINEFAVKDFKLNETDSALRTEMLQRSGFLPVRDFLMNLPLGILKHVAANPQREIERVVDRFAEELKRRWAAA